MLVFRFLASRFVSMRDRETRPKDGLEIQRSIRLSYAPGKHGERLHQ
jgi:hypothetical protein